MIEVFIDETNHKHHFKTPQMALRFMYAMRSKGHVILGWACDDLFDNDWLNKRFKL